VGGGGDEEALSATLPNTTSVRIASD